jgi:putative pyruvate formate lyase activating enzyme
MTGPSYLGLSEEEFDRRAARLLGLMTPCRLCPRECRVDRSRTRGYCRGGTKPGIASHNAHFGEEPPISGSRGSGTVFFHHCTMRCVFCQNFPISQLHDFPEMDEESLAGIFLELQSRGCHNINLVTPTHFSAQIVRAVGIARHKGLSLPLVYNTSGYERKEVVELLEGIVDIYLPDIKYADDRLAAELSDAGDYVRNNRESVLEMYRQVGGLKVAPSGVAEKGLIIRHLVLPGRITNTKNVLDFIASRISRETSVSLMSQYFPAWNAHDAGDCARGLTREEYDEAVDYALSLGLENALIQDLDAKGNA